MYKMTGNGTSSVILNNSGYVLNNINSTVKDIIDEWFEINLTNNINSLQINYVDYLEDTVFCSDRNYKTVEGDTTYPVYLNSGWNKSGGILTNYLYFGSIDRSYNNWFSTSNVPNFNCSNETDRFSVSNSKAKLSYPVGLVTSDEIVLAGVGGNGATNNSFYMYTGDNFWSMTPGYFGYHGDARMLRVNNAGRLSFTYVTNPQGIRPVVSLKLGVEFEKGNGTPTNPYIVKYN